MTNPRNDYNAFIDGELARLRHEADVRQRVWNPSPAASAPPPSTEDIRMTWTLKDMGLK